MYVIAISILGGLVSLMIKGYEHPPIGRLIIDGRVITTGEFVILMLLFVVIL